MHSTVPSVFDELEETRPIVAASLGARFGNYVIDWVTVYLITLAFFMIIGIIGELLSMNFGDLLMGEEIISVVLEYSIGIVLKILYFTTTETLFRGKTLGKLITGTRAVREDGETITIRDAFIRSICRFIPFEPLSAFGGKLWHDEISKTTVIRTR